MPINKNVLPTIIWNRARSMAKSILILAVSLLVTVCLAKAFSILGEVHGKDLDESYFVDGYPTILVLLNSEFFMGLIFVITLSVFAYIGYLLWLLHEIAVHKAQAKSSSQIQLIFALSLCGLFIHKAWWVVAIIIAFTSWESIAERISQIVRRDSHKEPKSNLGGESV